MAEVSSVVGMLLEHEELYTVIKSRQTGLLQHDGLTWVVKGGAFVRAAALSEDSLRTARNVHAWIEEMTPEQRELFVESLYQLLSSENAATLTDLASVKKSWSQRKKGLDPVASRAITETLNLLISLSAKNLLGDFLKKTTRNIT